jgi:hypothetical protein
MLHSDRRDADSGAERLMDRTPSTDLEQFVTLLLGERSFQFDLAVNLVERRLVRHAILAVLDMVARMVQPDFDGLKRPFLPSRIQRDGHGHSGSERRRDQLVGIGSAVGPSRRLGLVSREVMTAGGNLLYEPVSLAANDDGVIGLSH